MSGIRPKVWHIVMSKRAQISSRTPMEYTKQRRSAAPSEEGRLAASLAHEINNPLDSLLTLLYLMKAEATLTQKGSQYLMLAEEEVRRISQIAHAEGRQCAEPGGLRSRPLQITV
jgi:signal transduction histidine kinase